MAVRKPSSSDPIVIRVDHRESRTGIDRYFARDPEVDFSYVDLDYGDFACGGNLVIERKSPADVGASIRDRRFFQQHQAAADAGLRMIYILEGDVYRSSTLQPMAIIGAVAWLTGLAGSSAIYARNLADTAALVRTYCRHQQFGLGYEISLQPPKPRSAADMQVAIVAALPGVGEGKARKLLRRFGTIEAIFTAPEAEIAAVEGFGPKSAAAIRKVLEMRATKSY